MPKVNSTIKKILKEKDAGILTGTEAMNGILVDLQKQVMAELGQAALGSWDAYYMKQLLDSIERSVAESDLTARREISGQLDMAWKDGQALVDEPLKDGWIYMGFNI